MTVLFGFDPETLAIVAACYVLAGVAKGAVGFALPLVAVSLSVAVLPPVQAVALVAGPALAANLRQALDGGWSALWPCWRRFWPLASSMALALAASAQFLTGLEPRLLLGLLAVVVAAAALPQLVGWRPRLSARREGAVGVAAGMFAGVCGGLTGAWGPAAIVYLTALRLPTELHVRAAGLAFCLASLTMAPAHLLGGAMDVATLKLSALLVAPTMLGQTLGAGLRRRLSAEPFRIATLAVLLVAAANLLRRALFV